MINFNFRRVISCGILETPRFGRKSSFLFTPGARVSFECNEGFILIGDSRRICLAEGRWDTPTHGYTECMRKYLIFSCGIISQPNEIDRNEHLLVKIEIFRDLKTIFFLQFLYRRGVLQSPHRLDCYRDYLRGHVTFNYVHCVRCVLFPQEEVEGGSQLQNATATLFSLFLSYKSEQKYQ